MEDTAVEHSKTTSDRRVLASGEEAGTAPDDRRFRPDVEGLRAVAVFLVVLYHANVAHISGGYIGVDVFFVISGFVITGLLLRERARSDRTSILDFYARRCRRILPAATFVILATVLVSYVALGVVSRQRDCGRWAVGCSLPLELPLRVDRDQLPDAEPTTVSPPELLVPVGGRAVLPRLSDTLPVSGRSQAVFQLTGPTCCGARSGHRCLVLAFGDPNCNESLGRLFFPAHSGVGACSWRTRRSRDHLVAIPAPRDWHRCSHGPGSLPSSLSAFAFGAQTAYPGSLVAIPVVGAALLIAGGAAVPASGAEALLGTRPFQWLGRRSYSLYLLHWPILIIAAERVGKTSLPVGESLLLVFVAILLAALSYRIVENPMRHWRLPSKTAVAGGISLAISTVLVLSLVIETHSSAAAESSATPVANEQALLTQVTAAEKMASVPGFIRSSGFGANDPWGGASDASGCFANYVQTRQHICTLGDPTGTKLMVVYGDSHAAMWLPAFDAIAKAAKWRLVILEKWACPRTRRRSAFSPCRVYQLPALPGTHGRQTGSTATARTSSSSANRITTCSPAIKPSAAASWAQGLAELFASVNLPRDKVMLLGTTPYPPQIASVCLAAHPDEVSRCDTTIEEAGLNFINADEAAAARSQIRYIDSLPWFCATVCPPIVAGHVIYDTGGDHITVDWAEYLEDVLAEALGFPIPHPAHLGT